MAVKFTCRQSLYNGVEFTKEFIKEPVEFTKEFIKASRQIYKLISQNPQISAMQMSESMRLSPAKFRNT